MASRPNGRLRGHAASAALFLFVENTLPLCQSLSIRPLDGHFDGRNGPPFSRGRPRQMAADRAVPATRLRGFRRRGAGDPTLTPVPAGV